MTLLDYIKQKRGNAGILAKKIGCHTPDIYNWAKKLRPIPVEYMARLEIHTNGAISRKQLRPDDWWVIWPELLEKKAA